MPTRMYPDLKSEEVTVTFDSNRVRRILEYRDMTVSDLASDIGMDMSQLLKVINNSKCKYRTLDRIACNLGYHPLELMM